MSSRAFEAKRIIIDLIKANKDLLELCRRNGFNKPRYNLIKSERIDLQKFYTIEVSVESIVNCYASCISKRLARSYASLRALNRLRFWIDQLQTNPTIELRLDLAIEFKQACFDEFFEKRRTSFTMILNDREHLISSSMTSKSSMSIIKNFRSTESYQNYLQQDCCQVIVKETISREQRLSSN